MSPPTPVQNRCLTFQSLTCHSILFLYLALSEIICFLLFVCLLGFPVGCTFYEKRYHFCLVTTLFPKPKKEKIINMWIQFTSVQSLNHVQLLATPWIAACQVSLSITNSQSSLKLTSIKSVMPSSLCRPILLPPSIFPSIKVFQRSQLFASAGQSIGVSALASVLPKNTQDWSPLGWTAWTSLQSKGLSRVFSNTTVQKHQFFSTQLPSQSNSHIHMWPLEKL